METVGALAVKEKRTAPRRAAAKSVSHNLQGQRLGRKGRDTRQRILAAAEAMLADRDVQITLSAVARQAGLGMTSLYVYFSDLTELLLAVLEPIMVSGENDYLGHLRSRWPDDDLHAHCARFVKGYYAFWQKHTRILHLRNNLSEVGGDIRMARHRLSAGLPMVKLFVAQMDADPEDTESVEYAMATALFTGVDRLVAVRTFTFWSVPQSSAANPNMDHQLWAEARLLELAISDARQRRIAPVVG